MAAETFKIVDVNPNDSCGGGGCLCSETQNPDCEGPFVVFYAQELENPLSPNAVGCKRCILSAAKALEGEVIAGGERANEPQVIDVVPEEVVVGDTLPGEEGVVTVTAPLDDGIPEV